LTATSDKDPEDTGIHVAEGAAARNRALDVNGLQPSMDYGEEESAIGIAQKIFELGSQHIDEQATSAIPGYRARTNATSRSSATVGQRVPIALILGQQLPPIDLVYLLLEDYFDAVHWFSLVVFEPSFRRKLDSITDGFAYPSQKQFLLLLAVMLGMGAWYRSHRRITGLTDGDDWQKWNADLFKLVESHLVELMDETSITAAQICILLGSHYVYHGRPNLSFSLLGATIKISQAAGLHREPSKRDLEDIEERKRVWWTIYTWDRFASITYGRPLGINDKDCNLNMPDDVLENPYFIVPRSEQGYIVCYSTYQKELNRLYLMASKALEAVVGSRTSGLSKELAGDEYLELVKEATENIQRWRSQLPDHLRLEPKRDFLPHSGPSVRAHTLQSLSLQLTYDNILIVLHRPLLVRQVDHLSTIHRQSSGRSGIDFSIDHSIADVSGQPNNSRFEFVSPSVPMESPLHWWNAALRTSRVTELPLLAQLATDSHLVTFLAINLFNAAIVLAVIALSDPLSDTAQVVKRTITRILRLQDLLGRRSTLSKQTTMVLKSVITLLLRCESEAILAPITRRNQEDHLDPVDSSFMSVEDTLRLPLDAMSDAFDSQARRQAWPDLTRAQRLNESLTSVQNGKQSPSNIYNFGVFIASANHRSCFLALPLGDDRFLDFRVGRENHPPRDLLQESMRPDDQWQLSAPRDWGDLGVPSGSIENSTDGIGEGGLYWLWDMSWNGAGI
jgi:hypothetical protein